MSLNDRHPSSITHFPSLIRIFKETDQLLGHILRMVWFC
jgi:hypothetical protein